jgi:hypothetical protein
MLYVVSYDLRKPNKDYTGLTEQLRNSPGWWHYLGSTWLIATSESTSQLYNRLRAHLDEDDSILIIEAGNHVQGWLPKDAWEWIHQAIPNWQT